MPSRKKHVIAVDSPEDLLRSFLVELPPDYTFETMRLQIYPIAYFQPVLRLPMPPSVSPFSFLILNSQGRGVLQVNAEIHTVEPAEALFVHRGSVVAMRSLDENAAGWCLIFDDATVARTLQPESIPRLHGARSPIPLPSESLVWLESLCTLIEQQLRLESERYRHVADHLFGALVERLLSEGSEISQRPVDRTELVIREFRRLVFESGLVESSVGYYAGRLNISENYLCRCVSRASGRPPKDWIIDVRLIHAQKLLRTGEASVAEIAAQTGFDDPAYFSRLFRRRFGLTPRSFRTMLTHDLSGSSQHPS